MSYFALATLEITLLGLLSGVAGTLIVLRRRSFFAVALSHATYPGGVVFALLGYNLLIGQALFAVLLVLIMTALSRVPGQGKQVTSAVVLAFGFALGTLLTSLNAGHGVPVDALLVGSVLSVSVSDVVATGVVLVVSLVAFAMVWRRVVAHSFDPAAYAAAGFRVWPLELVVTGLIAAAVVVAMPAVGAILGVAILIAPAAAARLLAGRIEWIAPLAAVFGVVSGLAGLWVSREFDLAAGGAIGLSTTLVFIIALVLQRLMVVTVKVRTA
ncbi:MAG: metal ABC transporter permease [Leucobacter sp.]|jgi:ABC-type Mn2+/Zn2+ transport system permease subunit|nr:metal ABC transporter permease [Leucobacter sp.]